jgi:hypothetical protein
MSRSRLHVAVELGVANSNNAKRYRTTGQNLETGAFGQEQPLAGGAHFLL